MKNFDRIKHLLRCEYMPTKLKINSYKKYKAGDVFSYKVGSSIYTCGIKEVINKTSYVSSCFPNHGIILEKDVIRFWKKNKQGILIPKKPNMMQKLIYYILTRFF
jgi:hypothetical protein